MVVVVSDEREWACLLAMMVCAAWYLIWYGMLRGTTQGTWYKVHGVVRVGACCASSSVVVVVVVVGIMDENKCDAGGGTVRVVWYGVMRVNDNTVL